MTTLALDHPLVCTRALGPLRETYLSLGFKMRPPGLHPWGTSTALVLFRNQLLELVGLGDESLLDGYAAGEFRFGRHIQHWLGLREGVSLSALNTQDAEAAEAVVTARGGRCSGTINFGRDVIREDGQPDRTKTTLKIFENPVHPRLSVFACQQHRRDLLEFEAWMDHPNGAHGFVSAHILAETQEQPALRAWMALLHGAQAIAEAPHGFDVDTGRGLWSVRDHAGAEAVFGPIPETLADTPSVISLDIACAGLERLRPYLAGFAQREAQGRIVLTEPARLGGIYLTFQDAPAWG